MDSVLQAGSVDWVLVVFCSTPFLNGSNFLLAIYNTLINMHASIWCQLKMILSNICCTTVIFRVAVDVKSVLFMKTLNEALQWLADVPEVNSGSL